MAILTFVMLLIVAKMGFKALKINEIFLKICFLRSNANKRKIWWLFRHFDICNMSFLVAKKDFTAVKMNEIFFKKMFPKI